MHPVRRTRHRDTRLVESCHVSSIITKRKIERFLLDFCTFYFGIYYETRSLKQNTFEANKKNLIFARETNEELKEEEEEKKEKKRRTYVYVPRGFEKKSTCIRVRVIDDAPSRLFNCRQSKCVECINELRA